MYIDLWPLSYPFSSLDYYVFLYEKLTNIWIYRSVPSRSLIWQGSRCFDTLSGAWVLQVYKVQNILYLYKVAQQKRILFLVLAKHGVCDVINTTKRNRLDFYLHIRSQVSVKPQHLWFLFSVSIRGLYSNN